MTLPTRFYAPRQAARARDSTKFYPPPPSPIVFAISVGAPAHAPQTSLALVARPFPRAWCRALVHPSPAS